MATRAKPGGANGETRSGRQARGDRRERELLDAMESLLGEASLRDLSVDRIAARAGVSRTAFYFYFPSKEAALRMLVERSLESVWERGGEWLSGGGDDSRAALERGIAGVVETWFEHAALLDAVIQAAAYDQGLNSFWRGEIETFIEACAGRIERDATAGIVRRDVDARGLAEALCWMSERYCHVYLAPGCSGSAVRRAARVIADVWFHAIYG